MPVTKICSDLNPKSFGEVQNYSILIQKNFSVGFIIVPLIPLIITPLMHSCIFCLLVTSSIDYFNFALNTVILIVYKL